MDGPERTRQWPRMSKGTRTEHALAVVERFVRPFRVTNGKRQHRPPALVGKRRPDPACTWGPDAGPG